MTGSRLMPLAILLASWLTGRPAWPKPLSPYHLVITKSRLTLDLYRGPKRMKSYPIALGGDPVSAKQAEGDQATPEGSFTICMKFKHPAFYLSLGISYPDREAAERGLKEKLITREEYRSILAALRAGKCPPWKTKLGGEILVHGGGIGVNWTLGCVALENPDIEELYRLLPIGTRVLIRP